MNTFAELLGIALGVILGGSLVYLIYRAVYSAVAVRPAARLERLIDKIMRLPQTDRDALMYAVEKRGALGRDQVGPTLFELIQQFSQLPDDQQKAELAELRRRVKAGKQKP